MTYDIIVIYFIYMINDKLHIRCVYVYLFVNMYHVDVYMYESVRMFLDRQMDRQTNKQIDKW